jgi:5-methylcytosine-specific restriction endonuclease McrA
MPKPKGTRTPYGGALKRDPCSYCGAPGGTLDHVEAANGGGADDWSNRTGACVSCNSAKGERSLLLFLLYRRDLAMLESLCAAGLLEVARWEAPSRVPVARVA